MIMLTKDIKNRFKVLSLYTDDLFSSKDNLEILGKTPNEKQDVIPGITTNSL